MVGKLVVTVLHLDHRKGSVAPFIRQHERSDSGGIRSERENHQVVHQADVLRRIARFFRRLIRSFRQYHRGRKTGDPLFDLAHAGEVFVQLSRVIGTDASGEVLSLVIDEIEDALLRALLFGIPSTRHAEQSCKRSLRLNFLARRQRFRPPRNVVGIRTGIPGVARPCIATFFGPQLQRCEPSDSTVRVRRDLVGAASDSNLRACRLERVSTGEERSRAASVIPGTIPERLRVDLRQPLHHVEIVLATGQRLQALA